MKVIKRNDKIINALQLPVICNLNPRSIYNKSDEFCTLVEQEEIDVVLMSESWERDNKSLEDVIEIEDYKIFSNQSQRRGAGGRPAIIANCKKFEVKDLTNTVVHIPWGVEAVWCLVSPRITTPNSKVKKITCCALYFKPDSRKKNLFFGPFSRSLQCVVQKVWPGS